MPEAAPNNGNGGTHTNNGNGGTHTNNGDPHQRITICHATGSATNPYVRITISVNGLHGHGHHADDIIPAPDQGCAAAAAEQQQGEGAAGENHGPDGNVDAAGGGGIDGTGTPHVKGETGSGGTVDAAAPADAGPSADSPDGGSLPFTGLDVGVLVAVAATLLAGGLFLRRRTTGQNI